jgi:hypothetical protein
MSKPVRREGSSRGYFLELVQYWTGARTYSGICLARKCPNIFQIASREELMSEETQLTEHEKHNLNALKLFLDRSSDLKVLESGKVLDALSPEEVRAILGLYDRALKNPQLGTRALTIYLLRFL